MKQVYVAASSDPIHPWLVNLINNAEKYGEVLVGLPA